MLLHADNTSAQKDVNLAMLLPDVSPWVGRLRLGKECNYANTVATSESGKARTAEERRLNGFTCIQKHATKNADTNYIFGSSFY